MLIDLSISTRWSRDVSPALPMNIVNTIRDCKEHSAAFPMEKQYTKPSSNS